MESRNSGRAFVHSKPPQSTTPRLHRHELKHNESYSTRMPKGSGHLARSREFAEIAPGCSLKRAGAKIHAFMMAAMDRRLIMSRASTHSWLMSEFEIAARMHDFISKTACLRPTNRPRLTMLWPMFSSSIFGRRTTWATF